MKRQEAIELLDLYIKNENLRKHCLASEAVLRAMAKKLGADEDQWALAGLLHDLDVELVNADPKIHGLETAGILNEKGVDPDIIEAIKLHNDEATGLPRTTVFHHALSAGETITGLITATALVYPDKKLAGVKAKSIRKRMKEKHFAASVDRDKIRECEQAGIPLDEFIDLSLEAMQGISQDLGL
ncbi:MAG: HDIG domain-containing protein [Bacteroidales bacterium]|nr:HDIG domain-containing protein [Bacteroidales bacterium]